MVCWCGGGVGRVRALTVIDFIVPSACDILPCCSRVLSSHLDSHNGLSHVSKNHVSHPSKSNFKTSDLSAIKKLLQSVVRYPNVVSRQGNLVTIKRVFGQVVGVSTSSFPPELYCVMVVIKSECGFHKSQCKNCFAFTAYPIPCL